ncbi:hypothetical protein [Cupriavidus sp. IDO]|uniref:hypothetical protein n=1 Tax=Cupriavidus sp. IDO TaxID=1539142 RepID=UPI000579995C|nr:hypothetical protein [Cupriavidus sp. IDO]KWR90382.1 hypothetical protein RM96_10190 [Cupriavidus sp. IDO]
MSTDYRFMSAVAGRSHDHQQTVNIQREAGQHVSEESRGQAAVIIGNTPGLAQKIGYVGHGLSAAAAQQVAHLESQKAGYVHQGAGASLVIDEAYPQGHPMRKRWVSHGCR